MLRQYICWEEREYSLCATEGRERYHLHQINLDGEKLLEAGPINSPKQSATCSNFQGIASFLKEQRPRDKEGRYGRIILYSAIIGDDESRAPRIHLGENNLVTVSGRLGETKELKEIGRYLANMLENPVFSS